MDWTGWALIGFGVLIFLYLAAVITGRGFGRGYFKQKMQYNEEFLSKLDRRTDNGVEEQ